MKELLRKKSVKISLFIIVLLTAAGIIGINAQSAQKQEEYNSHMAAAEKYLTDLEYEQAIAEYNMALEIEPKSEEALSGLESTYLAYAGSVADTGDYERAIAILEEGYERTGRESLKAMISELQKMLEEEALGEEIKQLVESSEFQQKMAGITSHMEIWLRRGQQHITDEQVKELCRPLIEALEKYRELHGELNWEEWWYYQDMPELYLLAGEYELCAELRKELYEFSPEWLADSYSGYVHDSESGRDSTLYDEYGRWITSKYEREGELVEINYEYGENGKLIKRTRDDGVYTTTSIFEYDSEGRLSKESRSEHYISEYGHVYDIEYTFTYTYEGRGFTVYANRETISGTKRTIDQWTTDEEIINEYGDI